ncbi:MAG: hypothetical protein PHS74_11895 [Lachnospiraceae bacterium]|nr:hypothetical protein [Lachnospiraceae bacterium]
MRYCEKKVSIVFGILVVLGLVSFCLTGCSFIHVELTNQDETIEQSSEEAESKDEIDQKIMDTMSAYGIIGANDAYLNYTYSVGIFGAEGDKKYIYKQRARKYYFVEITRMMYDSEVERGGHQFDANEVFYSISVESCRYNAKAEYSSEYISYYYHNPRYYLAIVQEDGTYKIIENNI